MNEDPIKLNSKEQPALEKLPKKNKNNFLKKVVFGLQFSVFIVLTVFVYLVYNIFFAEYSLRKTDNSEFIKITEQASLLKIAELLHQKNIISNQFEFYWLARLVLQGKHLKTGYYSFAKGMSLYSILKMLEKGEQAVVKITIPEGYNTYQIFDLLSNSILVNDKNYAKYANSTSLISLTPFKEAKTIEGLLLPDTYIFPIGYSEFEVLKKMVEAGLQNWTNEFRDAAKRFEMTPYELLILASIIEKETSNPKDRRLVSSVFHNRMKIGMRLQTDPTVLYGMNRDLNITKKDLRTYTPYNTYMIDGLPPTPISNPGTAAIHAAMNPQNTKYLYFVAKGNGETFFSETLRQHNRAVYRYQILPHRKKKK